MSVAVEDNPPIQRELHRITKKKDSGISQEKKPDLPGFRTDNRDSQTRFHFRMDLCVGCHACEVACAEQNGLPVDTQWRRVGEVEAGKFPDTQRFFLSMGCNHCLDAACMKGCPVDAYQVNQRGVVVHQDDVCIGCQYCTWNCPYEVPVFQKDRNIVTKCDLCTNRLDDGMQPACVQACPVGAIQIETVGLEEIFKNVHQDGIGPDMPAPELTIPSTKITLPKDMNPDDFVKADRGFIRPEEPHTPLIWMTVLTQLGFGGFVTVFLIDQLRSFSPDPSLLGKTLGWLCPSLMAIIGMSLAASTLHLGRPTYAYRAIRNWRTSWLSREVIAFSLFAGIALVYSGFLLVTEGLELFSVSALGGHNVRIILGWLTVFSGAGGIYCSSKLYRVPARPVWNTLKTTLDFYFVAFILGPASFLVSVAISSFFIPTNSETLSRLIQIAAMVSFLMLLFKTSYHSSYIQKWRKSPDLEYSACANLYRVHYFRLRFVRNIFLSSSLLLLLKMSSDAFVFQRLDFLVTTGIALMLLVSVCLINRYLFFVTVIPKSIPGNFLVKAHDYITEN